MKDTTKLVTALKEFDINPNALYCEEDFSSMNEALDSVDMAITVESCGDSTIAIYYSGKLEQSIVLDWSIATRFNTIESLAKYLLDYEEMAETLEARICLN
jgi:hypothetical protein